LRDDRAIDGGSGKRSVNDGTFIAVEWGTARVRSRLLTASGEIVDSTVEDLRLAELDRSAQIGRLHGARARWPDASGIIWLAGMIGSPMGLEPVAQLPCPATPAMIAAHARRLPIDGLSLAILPGLSCVSRFGDPDFLRGEEVSVSGLIGTGRSENALLLSVPGMHGKWIELSASRVERFHTAMTVELYRVLADRSILAPLMATPARDGEAFRAGLSRSIEGGALARLLFSARTAVLSRRFSEEEAASYLWGVLIGSDVRDGLSRGEAAEPRCFVTGADDVAPLFRAALDHMGMRVELVDDNRLSAIGFAKIRQAAVQEEFA
jgi:2-dehydro-3-deoxygalactonokinase